jgi:hypothetical protein
MPVPVPGLLSNCRPSENDLLDTLRNRVDDSHLREIAKADYGSDFDTHLAHLREIEENGLIPPPWNGSPWRSFRFSGLVRKKRA